MGCERQGGWYYCRPQTFTATSNGVDFPLDILAPALAGAKAPRITRAKVLITHTGTTASSTGSARGDLVYQTIGNLQFKDRYGERINLTGDYLHKVAKFESPWVRDPAALGAGATVTGRNSYLWLPIGDLIRGQRAADWRWDGRDIFEGGQLLMNITVGALGVSTNVLTTSSVTIQPMFYMVDEKEDLVLPRGVWKTQSINANQLAFPLTNNGVLRYALQYIGTVGSQKVTRDVWAAQTFLSRILGLNSANDHTLVDNYDYGSPWYQSTDANATVPSEDPVVMQTVVPFVSGRWDQSFLEYPAGASFDWQTSLTYGSGTFASANNPQMILNVIEDRPSAQCGSNAVVQGIKNADGQLFAPSTVNPAVVDKLPALVTRAG